MKGMGTYTKAKYLCRAKHGDVVAFETQAEQVRFFQPRCLGAAAA
jgi:hypothetical protein